MLFMHEKDPAMNHKRALRTLSIQHRLHIGAAAPRAGLDDGSDRRAETPGPAEPGPALTLRTLFRRALRTLSIQHRLHIAAGSRRPLEAPVERAT